MRAFGVDISSVQGSVNWPATKASGITFAYAQGTRGVGHDIDPTCVRNVKGARAAGILTSLYHWWVWKRDPAQQAAEAEWAVDQVGGVDYPIALDFEYPTPEDWAAKAFDPEASVTNLLAMAGAVAARLGRAPLIYTYPYFMAAIRAKVPNGLIQDLGHYDLWIAGGNNYGKQWEPEDTDAPPIVAPWTAWRMWQFSANGGRHVAGIGGDVDRDAFNGSAADFQAWAAGLCPLASLPAGVTAQVQ